MADVLSKTSLFVSSNVGNYQNQQQNSISVFAKSCKLKGFPLKAKPQALRSQITRSSSCSDFYGKRVAVLGNQSKPRRGYLCQASVVAQTGLRLKYAKKWWEKGLQPNVREVTSAQDLVDSLMNAGDKLVVVDFFSPGCGGCKALHPKLCQLAELNPDVQFLQVNYEEHKSMCYSLNVHVLPFFRLYRGAHGRLCSFSCTNATIKKFKDALAKHTPDRCSLGPTKGLEEKELAALAANKDLSFTYTPKKSSTCTSPCSRGRGSTSNSRIPFRRRPTSSSSDSSSSYNKLEVRSRLGGENPSHFWEMMWCGQPSVTSSLLSLYSLCATFILYQY